MKNTIFKTVMMAVFALTLIVGNTLADEIEAEEVNYVNGLVSFTGSAEGFYVETGNPDTVYGFVFNQMKAGLDTRGMLNTSVEPGLESPTEDFTRIPDHENVAPDMPYLIGFPKSGFNFLDGSLNLLENVNSVTDFKLGTVGEFEFHITKIDEDSYGIGTIGNKVMLFFGMQGYVRAEGYTDTFAEYSFSADSVNGGNPWTWTMNVESFGLDYNECIEDPSICYPPPSEVPEPGSILLLGTGIIGLGIAARRKLVK